MAAVAFDTYKMIKRLRDAGFTDTQAEAVSGAVQEGSTVDLSILATKADLAETKAELKADNLRLETKIEAAKADILKTMSALIFSAVVVNALVIFGAVFGLAKMLGH